MTSQTHALEDAEGARSATVMITGRMSVPSEGRMRIDLPEKTSWDPWTHVTSSPWGSQLRKEAWRPEEELQVVLLLSLEDWSLDLLHECLSSRGIPDTEAREEPGGVGLVEEDLVEATCSCRPIPSRTEGSECRDPDVLGTYP